MKVIGIPQNDEILAVTSMYTDDTEIVSISVDNPPNPPQEQIDGKEWKLFLNRDTEELFWQTVDRPLTLEEENRQLKNRMEVMQQALDDLILNGGGGF